MYISNNHNNNNSNNNKNWPFCSWLLTSMGGAADVPELAEDDAALGVHGGDDAPPCFHLLLRPDPRRMREPAPQPQNGTFNESVVCLFCFA
jgi:hypothetical protein